MCIFHVLCIFRANIYSEVAWAEAHSEPSQTSNLVLFAEKLQSWNLLHIFTKSSSLDVWLSSEYASAEHEQTRYSKLQDFLKFAVNEMEFRPKSVDK